MSNQWEVVTKSKKQKNLDKKVELHVEKKRIEALGPKLEEILPSHKYQNLVGGKENLSPSKSTSSSSSSKSKSPKKQLKSSKTKDVKEPKKSVQPKQVAKPKSLEQAFRGITAEDFQSQLQQIKLTFPGSELLWLKGVASYFNAELAFDCDPTFSGKSFSYPSNLASQSLKNVIVEFLHQMGEANLEYFYHSLLNSMVMELSKNFPIVGYKFLLQLIAQNWPQICSNTMVKIVLLRNSYQNRSNICLSILWAVGQAGYTNLNEGIKVWQNLMLPNLELKSYTKFVAEYIGKVLSSATNQKLSLNQVEFFATFNALKANYVGMPKELQASLHQSAEVFMQKYIAHSSKYANLFLQLFRDIETKKNRIELIGCLSCLLSGDEECFKVWKMNYKKQTLPSLLLMQKIENDINSSAAGLVKSNAFFNFMLEIKSLNSELEMSKRKDSNLDELIAVLGSVQEKSSQKKKQNQAAEQKKKCGCCKWTLGSILIIALIGGVLSYDTEVNGKGVFAKSATGKVLQNAGVLPYVEKGWYTTMSAGARGYKWAEKAVPPIAKPACQLACDLFKMARNAACNTFGILRNFINAKLPVAGKFVDQYVPGLSLKIESGYVATKGVVVNVFDKTVSFFKTQVLIGRFSPENLSKTFNNTQNMALEYYVLFHKKVDAYAKLK